MHSLQKTKHILLCITGSVAALKGPELAYRLATSSNNNSTTINDNPGHNNHVIVLLSQGGEHFWEKSQEYNKEMWDLCHSLINSESNDDILSRFSGTYDYADSINTKSEHDVNKQRNRISLYTSQDEWKSWNRIGDPVLHIQLRDWADVVVIAPLSAHTLAKISTGLCDDTLSCVLRAWDFGQKKVEGENNCGDSTGGKPIVLAPAMNTLMWLHPLTKSQLEQIQQFYMNPGCESAKSNDTIGFQHSHKLFIVEPQVKTLACGETGSGAMASVSDIVRQVDACLLL